MENNKLKVKDLVNIGVFSAIYFIISMLVMALAMFFSCFLAGMARNEWYHLWFSLCAS